MYVCLFVYLIVTYLHLDACRYGLTVFVQHAEVMRVQGEIKEIFKLSPDQARGHEMGYFKSIN